MSEKDGGLVAPGVVEGAQEVFYRKRKRAYFRKWNDRTNGDGIPYAVLDFMCGLARKKMLEDLSRKLFGL